MSGQQKSVELSIVLIRMNTRLANDDWVDRLTWRMHRLVKLIGREGSPDAYKKAIQQLDEVFWSGKIQAYKLASGIIP